MKRNYAEIKVADAGFYHWYFGYETECDGDSLSASVNLEEAEEG